MQRGNYTILIVCEGEKTEPLFFNSIRDELIDNKYNNDIRKIKITIAPEPSIDILYKNNTVVKHKSKRKKRKTIKVEEIDKIKIIDGRPPLRWVLTAQRELLEGAFNEVWVVFDNDDHPGKKEAFEIAKKNKVNIAYSSRSFEYYLLIHFKKIYRPFNKTDCKTKIFNTNKEVYVRCGTNIFPETDCNGSVCINGYAQINNYWENTNQRNTKNSETTYSLIKDKLEIGFENAAWIRYKSDVLENEVPIYDRNPYLSTDDIVKKLIGDNNIYIWVSLNEKRFFKEVGLEVKIVSDYIEIKNISNSTILFQEKSITVITEKERFTIGNRSIIYVDESVLFNISKYSLKKYWFKIAYKKYRIMFENET